MYPLDLGKIKQLLLAGILYNGACISFILLLRIICVSFFTGLKVISLLIISFYNIEHVIYYHHLHFIINVIFFILLILIVVKMHN